MYETRALKCKPSALDIVVNPLKKFQKNGRHSMMLFNCEVVKIGESQLLSRLKQQPNPCGGGSLALPTLDLPLKWRIWLAHT